MHSQDLFLVEYLIILIFPFSPSFNRSADHSLITDLNSYQFLRLSYHLAPSFSYLTALLFHLFQKPFVYKYPIINYSITDHDCLHCFLQSNLALRSYFITMHFIKPRPYQVIFISIYYWLQVKQQHHVMIFQIPNSLNINCWL